MLCGRILRYLPFYLCAFTYADDDVLTPYNGTHHGSRLTYQSVCDHHREKYGTDAHELYNGHSEKNKDSPFLEVKHFLWELDEGAGKKMIKGHYAIISDPFKSISVLEPREIGGCSVNARETVLKTAKQKDCYMAVNAGFFSTHTGQCLGNVIANGKVAHNSHGIQNVHFGIKNNGQLFIGYISEEEVTNNAGNFKELVGGAIWILRNGSSYLNESKFLECAETEETGTMEKFMTVMSARTAVGHDKLGRVIIVQVDGKTLIEGISMSTFENILKEFGLVNAINLDGGGSATFIVNGTVANYPSDKCHDGLFNCERKVSTVLCVHPPDCDPSGCPPLSSCIFGECVPFPCGENNCSNHGQCTKDGCTCEDGYQGLYCDEIEDCFIKHSSKVRAMANNSYQENKWYYSTIILSVITAICIVCSLLSLYYACSCNCKCRPKTCSRHKLRRYHDLQSLSSAVILSDSSDSESTPMRAMSKR